MSYSRKTWADNAAGGTPITAADLNHIETGVSDAHLAIASFATYLVVVGTAAAPVTIPGQARPVGAACVYWICAAGVTPLNALDGDLIWNAA